MARRIRQPFRAPRAPYRCPAPLPGLPLPGTVEWDRGRTSAESSHIRGQPRKVQLTDGVKGGDCHEGGVMFRALLRLILVLVILVGAAAFFLGYWGGGAHPGERSPGVGTTGRIDTERAKEAG